MKLGYNTNGLAFHRWTEALELIAETGFQAVGLTLDQAFLDPFAPDWPANLPAARRLLDRLGLASVVETGARFLLDPRRKHEPTLLDPTPAGRERRLEFLRRGLHTAVALQSEALSFWSGAIPTGMSRDEAERNLVAGLRMLIDAAEGTGVRLAFEPEPGMCIETLGQFEELCARHDLSAPHFGLTIDVGHVWCNDVYSIPEALGRAAPRLFNVHLDDMVRGVHDHLRFGHGEIDFDATLGALVQIGYEGCACVELSRHGHMAPTVLAESFEFLTRTLARHAL